MRGGSGTDDPGQFTAPSVSLGTLLETAYGVRFDQISGPDWLMSEQYSISAKIPPNVTKDQFHLMLQNLLAERFHLTLHHGTKDFPAYELLVANGGPKMKPSPPVADAATAPPAGAASQSYRPQWARRLGDPFGSSSAHFVASYGRVSAAGAFQKSLGPRHIATLSVLAEVTFGPQGRQLLGHRDIDELVESHAFGFRNAARLFQY
jgi:uncharacterized protein (TIGR03435 family)